jgi:ATP-dependent Clp protease adaptor protein ClpS
MSTPADPSCGELSETLQRKCDTKFELREAYVSIFFMSAEPLAAKTAGPLVSTIVRPENAEASTIDAPTIERETREDEALDIPWQVVVHNDPVNLMSYVTMVFQRVFGYPRDRAEKHMLEVHHRGRSILWSGLREPAELYVQQLHGYLLLATLEKVS